MFYNICLFSIVLNLFFINHYPETFVGYSKAPKQPQSSARPIYHSYIMTSTGRKPRTIRIAAYRSLPCYALRHGSKQNPLLQELCFTFSCVLEVAYQNGKQSPKK